jgi:hypothetical protein
MIDHTLATPPKDRWMMLDDESTISLFIDSLFANGMECKLKDNICI